MGGANQEKGVKSQPHSRNSSDSVRGPLSDRQYENQKESARHPVLRIDLENLPSSGHQSIKNQEPQDSLDYNLVSRQQRPQVRGLSSEPMRHKVKNLESTDREQVSKSDFRSQNQ